VGPVEENFKETLLELAGSNKKDIVFTGPLHPIKDAEILANFYALSDVFVALGEWEGLPIRILEAKAYKIPVVENIKNIEKLAEKILECLLNKNSPKKEEYKDYFWPRVFKKIHKIYLKLT